MELKDAVAVVTGGNGGLGQRICHALAKEGANIAVVYAQSANEAGAVADELRKHGVEAAAVPVRFDASRRRSQRLVDEVVKRFGRLDILINDAAYNKSIPFKDLDGLTTEEWSKIIDVNLTGPMHAIKAVAPVMQKQKRGRIVNIASIAGLHPGGSSIAYAVSKAGLIHLTRCMAVALAPRCAGQLRGARPARRHARHREPVEDADRQLGRVGAAQARRRQGRLRRPGRHHVPHRDDDRPDRRDRFRADISLKLQPS